MTTMASSSSSSSIVPSEEQLMKLGRLSSIADHIQDISRKIADLTNDPLPGQMEQSMPGYNSILALHSEMLKRRRWMFVIAGDSNQVKSAFVQALLRSASGEERDLEDVLALCGRCPVMISFRTGEDVHRFLVSIDGPGVCNPVALENWETLKQFIQQVQNGPPETSIAWVTVQVNCEILKEDLELLVYPEEVTERNLEQLLDSLSNSDVLLYIADKANLDSTEKFQTFTSEMRSLRILNQQLQPLVMMNCCLTVIVSCGKILTNGDGDCVDADDCISVALLDESSGVNTDSVSSTDEAPTLPNDCADSFRPIIKAMNRTLSSSIDSRILFHFGWLQMYVCRVLHHLKSFLSQAERSHEGRQETYKDILARLTALTERSEAFLIALQQEIDARHKEGVSLLRNHLTSDEVTERLSKWTDEEAPDEELWSDIDSAICQRIQLRLRHEMQSWERQMKFFEVQRPRLIQLFERRFRGIKTRLSSVETMISRHNSHVAISDDDSPSHGSHSSSVTDDVGLSLPLTLPFNVTLHWTQKLAIGLAAPLLIPLAFAAALLGLPIIGGLAAKEYVAERLSEGKLREYRANKSVYLSKRTREALKLYVKSTALEDFVQSQLGAASRCIGQLRQEVPRQIEADRMQIVGLRDDDRETKDLERFYQPLFEVFEHCRLLLLVFRVLHIKRDKLEIDFSELKVPENSVGHVICDGLSGRLDPAQWIRRQTVGADARDNETTQQVSLKHIACRLDAKSVEDYLLEEEAYRFQACQNIAKLLAVTKAKGQLYHVLEPIRMSLRQHLATAPELMPPSSNRVKLTYLKRILLQVLHGLDYLHDRGWVHFDLSLDSVGVSGDGVVKLTNISCRKMFFVPRDVGTTGLLRFTHLPPEVLSYPPASYTSSAEMYSVGIAMYEMWTAEHAYWHDISHGIEAPDKTGSNEDTVVDAMDTIDKFLVFVESNRPNLRRFRSHDASGSIDATKDDKEEHEIWSDLMQRCWTDGDRVTCKALLQLVEGSEGHGLISIQDGYFDRG